jgi:hypothetical protein
MLAPPCIRQRLLCTAGAWHGAPRLASPIAAWILGETRSRQNYSEGYFFWRQRQRHKYFGPFLDGRSPHYAKRLKSSPVSQSVPQTLGYRCVSVTDITVKSPPVCDCVSKAGLQTSCQSGFEGVRRLMSRGQSQNAK